MRQVDDARVWAGLHWRHSMRQADRSEEKSPRTCLITFSGQSRSRAVLVGNYFRHPSPVQIACGPNEVDGSSIAGGIETAIDGDSQSGASPVELLLEALGVCVSVDVVLILERGERRQRRSKWRWKRTATGRSRVI